MLKVQRHQGYINDLVDLLGSEPQLAEEVEKKVGWFKKNQDDTRLDNHDLEKKLKGKWAFRITDDIRIVYMWLGKHEARFLAIGGHLKVYNKKHYE